MSSSGLRARRTRFFLFFDAFLPLPGSTSLGAAAAGSCASAAAESAGAAAAGAAAAGAAAAGAAAAGAAAGCAGEAVLAAATGCFGSVKGVPSTSSGNSWQNVASFALNATDASRSLCFSASVVSTEPVVGAVSSMNESTPLRMDATDQVGTHVSGWKSEMERHSRRSVSKRPLGVSM